MSTNPDPEFSDVYILGSVANEEESLRLSVWFNDSSDNGETWGTAKKIYEAASEAKQWFGMMSVAPNGRIDIVWNETENEEEAVWSQLRYAYSTDGGDTFSSPETVSPGFKHRDGWPTDGDDPSQRKLGDYYTMVSDSVGVNLAYAATFNYWAGAGHYTQDIYFLRIGEYDCNLNNVGDLTDISEETSEDCNENGIPDECEVDPCP